MVHQRQRLPLSLEPGQYLAGVHALLDELERHAASNGFGLFAHPHGPHTAHADHLNELVGTNPVTGLLSDHGDQLGHAGVLNEGFGSRRLLLVRLVQGEPKQTLSTLGVCRIVRQFGAAFRTFSCFWHAFDVPKPFYG
jgi:hypothetical protein